MFRAIFLAGLCGFALGQSTCETNRLSAVKNGKQTPQGANLGSWLLLEGWMVKNIWNDNGCDLNTVKGQYMLEKCLGSKAKSVMDKHWSSWITEDDFAEMSKRGINLVRIPVGWWHVSNKILISQHFIFKSGHFYFKLRFTIRKEVQPMLP